MKAFIKYLNTIQRFEMKLVQELKSKSILGQDIALLLEYRIMRYVLLSAFIREISSFLFGDFIIQPIMKQKKAIIIGASSGIGRELAVQLSQMGLEVGLVARRKELLLEIQDQIPGKSHVMCMDITDFEKARKKLSELIGIMTSVDYIIINAGIGIPDPNWEDEQTILTTNVQGFAAMAQLSFEYFKLRGKGCISGVSSIAGIRGGRMATAYCASKAFISNYMEGLRCRAIKEGLDINVTDIIPGFVDTPMTKKIQYKFWVASSKVAAKQAISSILKKKNKAYVTRKWALVALLMKIIPLSLYSRI